MNKFMLNETSYHGAGAIQAIPEEIKSRGFKKAFVASDPDLVKFGVTQKVTNLLEKAGIEYKLYSDIKPNPTIENVQHGVEEFKACGADCIVAIGGGSSMDTSKAVGIIIANPEFADVRSWRASPPRRTNVFRLLRFPPLPAPLRKSPSTMSSPMWRRSASSSAWTRMTFLLSPSSIPT